MVQILRSKFFFSLFSIGNLVCYSLKIPIFAVIMKILFSWLKDYIDIEHSPSQIAKILTMAGLEVDGIDDVTPGCSGVVVCKVIDVKKHPEADKLCLATVTDGTNTYTVVCGAPNCRPGIKTALAPIGAEVLDDDGKPFKIKKSKIRGIESMGMLCAPVEIGLNGSEGIIEFAEHINEGFDVARLYADTVFEISLTPNLGHCNSLIGVARELAAVTGAKVRWPEIKVNEKTSDITKITSVSVQNPEGCPRYMCRLIKNVKVAPSPEWMQKRLEASGVRPINNIVDATNYVMLELGHPLHAFDFDMIEGRRIIVRNARKGERFITLDGKENILEDRDLMICDQVKPIALAGVMGGSNSEISNATQNILLEAAFFDPPSIRRTSKRLGLLTDASKRFERGSDPNILKTALDRVAELIVENAGGEVCKGVIDIAAKLFPKKRVDCRLTRINKLLGTHLSVGEIEDILKRLEMQSSWDGQDLFSVEVPTYRNDVQEEIDLIEEVARVYGYDNIDKSENRFRASTIPHAPIFEFEREVRFRLIAEGLQEFLTCDLIGPALLDIVSEAEMPNKLRIKVLNPTSTEQSILRTSLLPGLLQAIKYNWDHQNHDIAAFEVGRIHFKEEDQYREQSVAGIVLSGFSRPQHWDVKPSQSDFFDLKGFVENLLSELKVLDVSFKPGHSKSLHPGRQASIWSGEIMIGTLGELHPSVLRRLDTPQTIFFAELNLHDLFQVRSQENKMQSIPVYPGSQRDWTITLEEATPIADVFSAIRATHSRLLESFSLLDVYRSEKLGKNLKNVTFRFLYRDKEKTIAQDKVDNEHLRLIASVSKAIMISEPA